MKFKKSLFGAFLASVVLVVSGCGGVPPNEASNAPPNLTAKVETAEVVFIHGMFVTPASWDLWRAPFEKAGYTVSAPAWPLHDAPIAAQRQAAHKAALGKLEFSQVVDHYRTILKAKTIKPILVGHSMGGIIAQVLLQEGLAQAAVAIDSAPPKGVFVLSWSFIRSNWGAINPFASIDAPIELDFADFSYAFVNAQPEAVRKAAFEAQIVPESRRVGKGPTTDAAAIDGSKSRGPLLIIAGEEDHIIPAALNYKNFNRYESAPARTDFKMLAGRDHWLIAAAGWEEVAQTTLTWLDKQRGR